MSGLPYLMGRSDGPDPESAPICWALHKEHHGMHFNGPGTWAVSAMIAETSKTWVRPTRGSGRYSTRRGNLDLIVGRYATRAEAEAARLRAYHAHADVTARKAAVEAEMKEATRPFRDRLAQLNAELADRIREETA